MSDAMSDHPNDPSRATGGDLAASTLTIGHAIEGGSGYRRREPLAITAFFLSPDAVDRALDALYAAGVPRDLMEVVVSRTAAAQFYSAGGPGRRGARGPGRETFRYAGAGALVGFIGGVVFSLLMLVWPGIDAPGGMAPVALFGPNVGTTAGAALGALFGFMRRQQPDPRYARAAEARDAILLAVHARSAVEAASLAQLMVVQGGRDARIEAR
jgi:hypothetical protein